MSFGFLALLAMPTHDWTFHVGGAIFGFTQYSRYEGGSSCQIYFVTQILSVHLPAIIVIPGLVALLLGMAFLGEALYRRFRS